MTDIATTTALSLPTNAPYSAWIDAGHALAHQKRNLDWVLGDWIGYGRQHYPEQIALDFPALTEVVGDAASLKRIEKTVAKFPAHLRVASLSFEHHAHLVDMPIQDALPLLQLAATEKLTAKQVKVKATISRIASGQQTIWKDEDIDYTELMSIVRAWNCARPHIREEFLEMASTANKGIIEA